jgi:hypothetical protein
MARASQRDRLLDEGLMSYLKAVAALRTFRQEVFQSCRAIVEREMPRIERALKQNIPPSSLIEYSEPSGRGEAFLDPDYAWLGVTFDLPKAGSFYAGMGWWPDADGSTPHPRVSATLWLEGQSKARRFGSVLTGQSSKMISGPEPGESELVVERRVLPQTSRSLEKALEGCLGVWINVWKHASGLQKIVSKASAARS